MLYNFLVYEHIGASIHSGRLVKNCCLCFHGGTSEEQLQEGHETMDPTPETIDSYHNLKSRTKVYQQTKRDKVKKTVTFQNDGRR